MKRIVWILTVVLIIFISGCINVNQSNVDDPTPKTNGIYEIEVSVPLHGEYEIIVPFYYQNYTRKMESNIVNGKSEFGISGIDNKEILGESKGSAAEGMRFKFQNSFHMIFNLSLTCSTLSIRNWDLESENNHWFFLSSPNNSSLSIWIRAYTNGITYETESDSVELHPGWNSLKLDKSIEYD